MLISSTQQLLNSWILDDPGNVGIPAHSAPNYIVTAVDQQASNGTPSLTILYPGSTIKSFDLHSFYFGCGLDSVEGLVGVAAQCTITVAGLRNEQEVAVASYTFSPLAGETTVPLIQAVLPAGFTTSQNVTSIQNDPTADAFAADDFVITTHT